MAFPADTLRLRHSGLSTVLPLFYLIDTMAAGPLPEAQCSHFSPGNLSILYALLSESLPRLLIARPQTICFFLLGKEEGCLRAPEHLDGHGVTVEWENPALGCRSRGVCGLFLLFL